ncbi:hypothetical protein [Phaeobacter italicus]|uniref:hypothetical protein n=1 Tax=Phaeobacter italicus TaxID=481446 RepID=UPI00295ED18C|nr:hypothetical protein [Phaeobacter italicus]
MASDAFAQNDRAIAIQTSNTAGCLPQINAQNCDLHQNAPPSPLIFTTIAVVSAGRQFIALRHTKKNHCETAQFPGILTWGGRFH